MNAEGSEQVLPVLKLELLEEIGSKP